MPPSRKINKISLYCANCAQFYSKFVLLFSLSIPRTMLCSFVRSFGVCTFVFIGLWFCLHKHRRHLKSLCAFPDFRFVYDCISVCVCVCSMWLWLYDPKCDRKTKHWTVLAFLQTYSFHINVLCTCYDNIVFKIWRCCFSFALADKKYFIERTSTAREGTTNLNKSYLFD